MSGGLRKMIWPVLAVVLVSGGILLMWPPESEDAQSPAMSVAFGSRGVLEVEGVDPSAELTIRDAQGKLVAKTHSFGREAVEVLFDWKAGETYRIESGSRQALEVRAPDTMPILAVRFHAPLGQPPHEVHLDDGGDDRAPQDIVLPVAPKEAVDLMVEAEKLADGEPIQVRLKCEPGDEGKSPIRLEPGLPEDERELAFEFDKQLWTTQARVGERLPDRPMLIRLHVAGFTLPFRLRFISRNAGEDRLSLATWNFPTEETGEYSGRRVPDQLNMPNPVWDRLASWFNIRPAAVNFFEPFAYQTLWLRNSGRHPMVVLLTSDVLDPETRAVVPWFRSPRVEATGGTGEIVGFATIPPGEVRGCVLPVFVAPETPAGNYLRRVRVSVLGRDAVLETLEGPLGVTRSHPLFSAWVLGISILSVTWLAFAVLLYRRIVGGLGVRVMVLLALLGSLQFCLHFVGGLVSNILYAVLGPFNCLVGGLLTEVLTYLLVTSILFLVPRVGAMTLAGIVTYLMGGIMFGSFGLTDILFVGSAIAFREVLLFVFGVTRFRDGDRGPPNILAMMLALGLADAASTFTSLALHSVFYRLFFADWFIVLQVGVTGFLYTMLGVFLGRSLGMRLREVRG